jgi:tRNA splicing endonuclease
LENRIVKITNISKGGGKPIHLKISRFLNREEIVDLNRTSHLQLQIFCSILFDNSNFILFENQKSVILKIIKIVPVEKENKIPLVNKFDLKFNKLYPTDPVQLKFENKTNFPNLAKEI